MGSFIAFFVKIFTNPIFTFLLALLLARIGYLILNGGQNEIAYLKKRAKVLDNRQKELEWLIKTLKKEIAQKEAFLEKLKVEVTKIRDAKTKIQRRISVKELARIVKEEAKISIEKRKREEQLSREKNFKEVWGLGE